MNKYIHTILFVIVASLILVNFDNKSNFPTVIMIPLIVSGLTKYVLGDWDKDYQWSYLDVFFWISTIGTSYFTILLFKRFV
jgi:hypothetical protein